MSQAHNSKPPAERVDEPTPTNTGEVGVGPHEDHSEIEVKFPLGQTCTTPGALALLTHEEILAALRRHQSGDWGEVDEEDKMTNDKAVAGRDRIFSVYKSLEGTDFWVITEWDRSATTVLLPSEY
jgi:hypothetical protein